MDTVLLSIVVPVYNVESYLQETVDSILSQLNCIRGGCEILLIDDGSTDSSGVLCDTLAAAHPGSVRVFHKDNEGLLLTRRFGFRHARGTYILNCDSDDTLEPGALDILTSLAEKLQPDVLIYNINAWTAEGKTPFSKDMFREGPVSPDEVRKALFLRDGAVSMCGKMIKRSCLDLENTYADYYKKSLGEDTLQSIEIYSRAKTFYYCNRQLYNYRSCSGMTGKANPVYFQSFMPICKELEARKEAWQLSDFDGLMAQKIFTIAGRAITQSRFDKKMPAADRIRFLKSIRTDEMFQKYESHYATVVPSLKRSYRMLLGNLMKKRYRMIDLSLRIKNLLSR